MWEIKTFIEIFTISLNTYSIDLFFTSNILISFADLLFIILINTFYKKMRVKNYVLSFLFYLLFEFISIYNFFEISKSFSSIVKYLGLFDSFSYDLIEDDLET